MSTPYDLNGTFIEACNCKVICPCWVDDDPDEDHCVGLFAWRFEADSTVGGFDVAGHSVAVVTVHEDRRRGGTSQSVVFVDRELPAAVWDDLVLCFSGRGGGPLAELAPVTGEVVHHDLATIVIGPDGGGEAGDGWEVTVTAAADPVAVVRSAPLRFDGRPEPLALRYTALSAELGVEEGSLVAHRSEELVIDLATLPGPPVSMSGRAAMSGRFTYRHDGHDGQDSR